MAVGPVKKTTANSSAFPSDSDGYTRLHITPLDPELLPIVVPAASLPQARNVSYHSLEAFPERRYGYVDLPTAEAERLRKKLNGAILKGTKMRIEQARPESIPQPTGAAADDDESQLKRIKRDKKAKDRAEGSKKRKRTGAGEVVEGVKLEDRKIKRGWTVTENDKIQEKRKEKSRKSKDKSETSETSDKYKKDKKDKKKQKREVKSKYTDGPECLFKQKLPEPPSAKKQDDDEEDGHRRKKRKGDRQVLVHEFEKTVKYPSFLKSSNDTTASEPLTYEDGKGWMDKKGNIVEAATSKRPSFSPSSKPAKKQKAAPAPVQDEDDTSSSDSSSDEESDDDAKNVTAPTPSKKAAAKPVPAPVEDDTSSSDSSSDSDSDEEDDAPKAKVAQNSSKPAPKPVEDDDDTSSSGSSSDDDDESSSGEEEDERPTKLKLQSASKKLQLDTLPLKSPVSSIKADSARPRSSGSTTSLTIKIPPATPSAAKVHPLEALYKRPQGDEATPGGTAAAESKPFSFFDNDDIEEEEPSKVPSGSQNPMTPYTKQDFEFRNVRSAAPTPDTAHPSRSYNLWPRTGSPGNPTLAEDEEDDEEQEDEDTPMGEASAMATGSGSAGKDEAETSEFQKWFWENRGDLNRSWKKRRKTATKEKRNRENRARAAKAI